MSVFSIYRPDGILLLEGDRARKKFNWEGTCYRSIMGVSTLQFKIELESAIDIPVGSFIDYGGHRYTLYYPHSITKLHTKSFEYQLLFHGEEEELKLFKLKDVSGGKPYRLKFFLTAKPIDFLRVIVDTLNLSSGGWTVGDCIDASEKTIAFNHENCFAVLQRVAQEFDSEWNIEGKQISLGKVTHMADTPLAMQYGYGNGFRSGVGRRNDADSQPIGRLYVEGGKRNIDRSKYGSSTLLLPKNAILNYEHQTYRTDADGMSITCDGNNHPAEDSYDGSGVYPMREGTVSEVVQVVEGGSTFYDIKDNSIPASLNFNDYRIKGEKATIVFQSGALAGREFDIVQTEESLTGYIHEERRFKLVPAELDGFEMPGGTFIPAVGDKYALFNISLPNEYLSNASQKMFEEAVKYFHEHSHPTFMFEGEVDPIWAIQNWLEVGGMFVPGGHILFSDPQFHPGGSVIRIIAVKTPIGEPYQPELTLSNAPLSGSFASTLGKLEAEPVLAEERERGLRQYTKRYWQDAKESQNMLLQAMGALGDEFTSTLSPIALQTMQVLVGSAALQYRFVTSKAAPATANHLITWNKVGVSLDVQAGIIQHRTLGIDTITFNRKPSDFRYWDLPRYKSPALTNQLTPYYLYAKVEKNGTVGAFELDDKARPFESASHFNLLVGLLSSEKEGMRSFAPMYSYSELTPDGLTTRLIKSLDGSTYFDLERGEIGGNILFRGGSLDEWAEDTEDAVAKSGYQIHCPFTEVFSVNNDSAGYGACKCSPKLYKYGNELPIDISKLRVFRKAWAADGTILNSGIYYELNLITNNPTNSNYFIDDVYNEAQSLYGIQLDVVYAEAWETISEDPYDKPVNILATNSYTYYHVQDGKKGEDGKDAHSLLFTISINGEVRNGEVSQIWFPKLTVMYDGSEITDYEMVSVESRYNRGNWGEKSWDDSIQSFELDIIDVGYTEGVRVDVRIHYRGLTATNSVYIPNTKDGNDGATGTNGVSVTKVDAEFAKNSTPGTAPSLGWQTTAPTITGNEQLWTRTKTAYSSGNPTYTSPVNITPKKGNDGRSADRITEEYAISTSKTVQPTIGWSISQPTWEPGKYIWSRVKIEYSNPDGTEYTGYSCSSEWEAINELQIGGRNLHINSKLIYGFYLNRNDSWKENPWGGHYLSPYYKAEPETFYTLSNANILINTRIVFYDSEKNVLEGFHSSSKKTMTVKSPINTTFLRYSIPYHIVKDSFKLEKGTVATDWSEAPEDVEARITDAKAQADKAVADAKAAQDRANDTYTKAMMDGIITAEEEQAIHREANVAQMANLYADDRKAEAISTAKSYTDGKVTAEEQARTKAISAQAETTKAQAEAYADGKVTAEEQARIKAMQEAEEAAKAEYARLQKAQTLIGAIGTGKPIIDNPTFADSGNVFRIYDLTKTATNTLKIIDRTADNPVNSGFQLRYTYGGANATPGLGGFFGRVMSRANGVFVVKIIAKIPKGYKIANASNAVGYNPTKTWLSSQDGTGDFETYYFALECSSTGTFNDFGFFYFIGTSSVAQNFDIAFYQVYDITDYYNTAKELQDKIDATNKSITDLQNDVSTSIRDGILDDAEKKSLRGQINLVSNERDQIIASYDKVYVNTQLEGTAKTNLLNAKISYEGAVNALINTLKGLVIKGTAIDANDRNTVNSQFSAVRSALVSLQIALDEANEYLRKVVEGKVDNVGKIVDTRDTNQPPSWYRAQGMRSHYEFKKCAVIELPDLTTYFCQLTTTVKWRDRSGGRVTQKAVTDTNKEYTRVGTSDDTAWGAWSSVTDVIDAERQAREAEEAKLQTAINQQKYITRAMHDGSTNVSGGLVLTNVIAVKDTPSNTEVISKEAAFNNFDISGQDVLYATITANYQLGAGDVTAPTGAWSATIQTPTLAMPVLWTKLHIGYQDDAYYSSEVTIPVAYYYKDNPVVSVTPELSFSGDVRIWQSIDWYISGANSTMGGNVRARAVVKYTKPVDGNVVGYMSALGGDMPFIGAGVQNFRGKGGIPESRMVEIWQNGRFKFADLRYNPQNNELEWVTNGEPYMTHGGTPLSIAQLKAQAGETVKTIASFSVNSRGVHTLPNSALTLTKEGGEFKFSTRLMATATIAGGSFLGNVRDDYIDYLDADCTVSLFLRRTHGSQITHYALGTSVIATASVQVQQRYMDNDRFDVEFYWGSTSSSTDVTIEDRLTNLPVGSYDLYLSLGYSSDGIATVSGSAQITNLRGVMYDSPNINYIRYTSRGMMAYYGISKHFVIDKDDPKAFVTLKGATDLPGILAGGRCDSYGTVNYQWGRYADAQGYTKARVEKIAYGKYKVHHSIGHTRYTPQVTVENVGSLASANFTDIRETYFVAMIYGSSGLRDAAFSYNCIGDNL